MRARPAATAALLGILLLGIAPARANANAYTWKQTWFPSTDGTMLRADVMLPGARSAGDRHPVILSIGPYFGRNSQNGHVRGQGPVLRFADLMNEGRIFERGYAYVQVDSRGYGGSDGCNDFGGPGERSDAAASVSWAATQPWSTGRVGMWGKSYDAWTQVMALAANPIGLEAAVIQAPIIDGFDMLFMNGVHYDAGWYATPNLYAQFDLTPTTATDAPPEEYVYPAKGTATNPACYADNHVMTPLPYRSLPYWQRRELAPLASRSRVPVLWSHGFLDANTKPNNFLPVYEHLRGPKRVWAGPWDHVRGNEADLVGRDGFMVEAMEWFDHYLKGLPLVARPGAVIQDSEGKWRSEAQWPPSDVLRLPLSIGAGVYDDAQRSVGYLPREVVRFTPPAPHDLRIAGTPRARVELGEAIEGANLIVQLFDVPPEGEAKLITRGAYRLDGPAIEFDLYPTDWVIRAGRRLGVLITAVDPWFSPTWTRSEVSVTGGTIEIPYLQGLRTSNLDGNPARVILDTVYREWSGAEIGAAERPAEFPPPMQ